MRAFSSVSRRLAPIAGTAVLALAMAACGGGSTDEASGSGGSLDVFFGANASRAADQAAWFARIKEQFKAKTGADVNFETFAAPADELTKIQTSVVSGSGPDLYVMGTTFTPVAYSTGAFVELTDDNWKAVGGRDRFVPSSLGISGPDSSHQIAVPFATRPFVMAYNKELFSAAGIASPPKTWDEFRDDAKKLTSGDVHGLAIGYKDSFDPWKFIWAMALQQGTQLVEGDKAQLTDPSVVKAFQTYFGWLTDDKVVDPAATGWNNAQAIAAFASGKAAMVPMISAGSLKTLEASPVKGKYAYAEMPTIPPGATALPSGGVGAASILSGDNITVAKYTKNKALALKFIELITSEAEQTHYTEVFGDLPANAAAATKITTSSPLYGPILQASKDAHGTPFNGGWSNVQIALVNVVVQSLPDLAGGKVSESALTAKLAEAQKSAQDAISRAAAHK